VKVGGLADVTGALAKELARLGHEVFVFLPRPPSVTPKRTGDFPIEMMGEVRITLGDCVETAVFERYETDEQNLHVVLIRHDGFFDRPNPYVDPETGTDWPDNARRYIFFSKAVIEGMRFLERLPDVIHLNDYQTGLVPILLREAHGLDAALRRVGTVYAIHNLGYQGIYPPEVLDDIHDCLEERFLGSDGPLGFFGRVNLTKAGILYADLITTVSERYAQEIQEDDEHGFGLQGILRMRSADLIGILNGIDPEIWNPETDRLIPHNYSASNLGPKRENKARLLQAMELPEELDVPVVGMISRLVDQKGFDLLEAAAEEILAMDLKLVVLGNGQPRYEELIKRLREDHPAKLAVNVTFNDPLAHLIEAGSDFFLMPSRYEPCGLNQMYSLRYGTIPIVRATGGLSDTVLEYDLETGRGNGFVFEEYDAGAMCAAIRRGLAVYKRQRPWKKLLSTVMRIDHSWTRAARAYVEVYRRAAAARR